MPSNVVMLLLCRASCTCIMWCIPSLSPRREKMGCNLQCVHDSQGIEHRPLSILDRCGRVKYGKQLRKSDGTVHIPCASICRAPLFQRTVDHDRSKLAQVRFWWIKTTTKCFKHTLTQSERLYRPRPLNRSEDEATRSNFDLNTWCFDCSLCAM